MFEIHPVKKVSVVIPVYNEQESLPELIRRTTKACESLGKEYEILLIDDGSSDNSAHMLVEASQAEGSHIVSILLNRNYGQHSAIMAGFSDAPRDKCTLSCAINGIHAAFHYLKKNYISGCVMTVPTGW